MDKIDFVIPWVDGNDKAWQEERKKYDVNSGAEDRTIRYRDWDNLKYWFRGVEKYAPWVNKIYFITWGHIPEWLNTENEKLVIVNHKDYIPEEYLPTFSSHTIELNMHRIKGLSEKFVYFNDDMFINNYVKEEDFFKNGLPCASAILNPIVADGKDIIHHIFLNNMEIINSHFNMKISIKNNKAKWFTLKNRQYLYRNIVLLPWHNFPGFKQLHTPNAFLKSTFETIWNKEKEMLDKTCKSTFRSKNDVSQYVFKDWQIAEGKFYPADVKNGQFYNITNDNSNIIEDIKQGKHKMICLNDSENIDNYEKEKEIINKAFEEKLSSKCSFEK